METIILAIRLGLRRGWRGLSAFLERSRLNAMSPVTTIVVMLVIGLVVPMALGVDRTPASLSADLAVQRLKRFDSQMPETSPVAETFCPAPAFHWKEHPDAKRYRLELFEDGVLVHFTDSVATTHYLLPAPGTLQTGRAYRFTVQAIDRNGAAIGQVGAAAFSIKKPDEALVKVGELAAGRDAGDAALIMAGLYAERNSVHDVRSALTRYLSFAPKGDTAEVARAMVARR